MGHPISGPELVEFLDSEGVPTYVRREDLNNELVELYSNPEALRAFNQSIEDFRAGRFVDVDFESWAEDDE